MAESAVMRLSTTTRVVQRLQKNGLVRPTTRAADARVTEVHTTPSGEKALQQVREVASRIYQSAFEDLDGAEIETLNGLLRRVFNNL